MLEKLTTWLLDLAKKIIVAIWDFFKDILIEVFDLLLNVASTVWNAIPVPSFLTTYSLNGLTSGLGSDVLWFVSQFNIDDAFLLIGGAWAFRLTRKALTLGQW